MADQWHFYDRQAIDEMEKRFRAQFINALPGFRAVNLVGTVDEQGLTNLSIKSSVVHLGSNPPLLGLVVRPGTVPRHSLDNIMDTGHYTLNHLAPSFYTQGHQTSAKYPREVSEFEAVGLTPWFHDDFPAPYVKESPFRIGLRFLQKIDITLNGTHFIIGEVLQIHSRVPPGEKGFLNLEKTGTIAGSGLDAYYEARLLGRLSYAKPDQPLEFLNDD